MNYEKEESKVHPEDLEYLPAEIQEGKKFCAAYCLEESLKETNPETDWV